MTVDSRQGDDVEPRAEPVDQPRDSLSVTAGTAAITGAAGGLGAAFARNLAAQGYNLFLTDQNAAALESLSRELSQERAVTVTVTAADLSRDADVERLQTQLSAINDLSMLVNNAGFGTYTLFHDADLARQLEMVKVHVTASMRFCHAVVPEMIHRHGGSIINVASAGAFMRFPRDATYIGTKAFLVAFTECLAIELAGTGVSVQALCPAWIHTGFSAAGDYGKVGYRSPIPGWLFTSPDVVVSSSLSSLGKGRVRHIPTIRARVAVALLGSRLGLEVLRRIRKRRKGPN